MKHLKWFGTGLFVLGAELGLMVFLFKTHYGPYIFLTLVALGGCYLMGLAIHKGK